ncbi:MAG TPA: AraC family transcriptional regulator [Chitinophagaceae bacterium]|jgi:AraC-like DNA-binding protein|nr:AraC family transcriptional regulator [Chitinophagaceae bacterium]
MSPYFKTITEKNKLTLNKGGSCDAVYYSELNEWFTANAFRSFSLKYVVDKCIYYKVGNKEHEVSGGSFLLACKQPYVKAYFTSKEIVKSICIDICPDTVAEAFTIMSAKEDWAFDNYLSKYFTYPEFFESVCPVDNSQFNRKLNALVAMIHHGDTNQINKEWFLDLAEKIVYHAYGNYLALNGIQSVKLETRKELLQRLYRGKQYIDENFLNIQEIGEVAAVSNLSEFHFFRSFKQAFGTTTYQYILNKKLELAKSMLQNRGNSITEIASVCNFPDLFTFSKAFKRHFGVSPSQIQKK